MKDLIKYLFYLVIVYIPMILIFMFPTIYPLFDLLFFIAYVCWFPITIPYVINFMETKVMVKFNVKA